MAESRTRRWREAGDEMVFGVENGCGDTKDTGANSDDCRTLVYVEGDASMRKYESREGKTENALSIVQRLLPPDGPPRSRCTAR